MELNKQQNYAGLSKDEKLAITNSVECEIQDMGGGFGYYRKRPLVLKARKMRRQFLVKTLEGIMTGKAGDWLVIGIKGELYPVADNIFKEIYIPDRKE